MDVPVPIAAALGVIIGTFLLYRSLQPKPIQGIPIAYPPGYTTVPWFTGFGGAIKAALNEGKSMEDFLTSVGAERYSVYQLPLGPAGTWFAKLTGLGINLVCCADPQEIEDVCTRRAGTFVLVNPFTKPIVPYSQICLTDGPEHRHRRRVLGPAMTGGYLAKMLPRLEESMDELVALWQTRAEVAQKQGGDRVISCAKHDMITFAIDVITSVSFGASLKGVVEAHESLKASAGVDASASPPPNRMIDAAFTLLSLVEWMVAAGPFAPLYGFYYTYICKQTRQARRDLIDLVSERLDAERKLRQKTGEASNGSAKPIDADQVLGMILDGEAADLAKGVRPLTHPELCDEMIAFIVAGSETTEASLGWTLKYLSRAPDVQHRLREELLAQLPAAFTAGGGLEFKDLQDEGKLPYLHAVVWECLRCARPVGFGFRTSTTDTSLLGYHLPKGTGVFMHIGWVSGSETEEYRERAEKFTKEGRRDAASRARKCGWWSKSDVEEFRPERWLKKKGDIEVFDRDAGPWQVFGNGPRGCYGKSLAILEMKVAIAKLVAHFFFERLPPKFDSDKAVVKATRHPLKEYMVLKPYDTVV